MAEKGNFYEEDENIQEILRKFNEEKKYLTGKKISDSEVDKPKRIRKLTKQQPVKISENQYNLLKQISSFYGITIAEYIRNTVVSHAREELNSISTDKLKYHPFSVLIVGLAQGEDEDAAAYIAELMISRVLKENGIVEDGKIHISMPIGPSKVVRDMKIPSYRPVTSSTSAFMNGKLNISPTKNSLRDIIDDE